MVRAGGRPGLQRDTILFAGCMALSIAALLLPRQATDTITTSIRETALMPLLWLQLRAEEGRTSRARFQATEAQRDSASIRAQSLAVVEAENARLRALLDLKGRMPAGFLAGEVLHQSLPTDGRTLLLSVGLRQGARPFQPVITPEGLLGVVSRSGPSTSVANTWAHPEFRVSAVTDSGEVLGIVAPSASPDPNLAVLEFRGVAYRDTVPDGTLVVTAGLGGVFPRGIAIGRVSGVRREELGWERVYRLVPMVNPGVVSHVLLLTATVVELPQPAVGDSVP
jgi:rod shape-determining protein MreC